MTGSGDQTCAVVGYDGSEAARMAVEGAAREVGEDGRLVIVCSAGPAPELAGAFDLKRVITDGRERARAELEALLMEAPAEVVDKDVDLVIDERPPAKAILEAAEHHDADLIVIGSRGLGARRTALGSVSNGVLHRAKVPVLVYPERLAHGEPGGSERERSAPRA